MVVEGCVCDIINIVVALGCGCNIVVGCGFHADLPVGFVIRTPQCLFIANGQFYKWNLRCKNCTYLCAMYSAIIHPQFYYNFAIGNYSVTNAQVHEYEYS